jgi:hypothetical protein
MVFKQQIIMPNDNNPFPPTPPDITIRHVSTTNKIPSSQVVKIRATCSEPNAARFVAIFDMAIDNYGGNDIFIPVSAIKDVRTGNPLKLNTARHRLREALNYLLSFELSGSIKGKYKPEDYAKLRTTMRIGLGRNNGEEGLLLQFIARASNSPDERMAIANAAVLVSKASANEGIANPEEGVPIWQQKIEEFIGDGGRSLLVLEGNKQIGQLLTIEEIELIKKLFVSNDIECEVTSTLIKAIK